MTNEERDLIAKFIARVGGQPQSGGSVWGGSVPSSQPPLPPVDREADQFIAQQFQQNPEARYRITQMAFVQEAALVEMQNRVQRLEWELQQSRNAMQHAQQQPRSGGLFGGLFGGGQRQGPMGGYQPNMPPPQPQYPPGYQPGMFQQQRGGSGFLGTALAGAAGVAGGMVLGNALMGAFSGSSASTAVSDASGGVLGGGSPFDQAGTAIGSPTAGFGDAGGADPFAAGGASKDMASNTSDGGWDSGGGGDAFGDAGGWDSGGSDDSY